MGPKTRTAETDEFCLVLSPELGAAAYASQAIREHYRILAEETRRQLVAVVSELVDRSVEQRPGAPITVTAALSAESIRGEVADHGDRVSFEIPLAPETAG
jgi:hypothetical protein